MLTIVHAIFTSDCYPFKEMSRMSLCFEEKQTKKATDRIEWRKVVIVAFFF